MLPSLPVRARRAALAFTVVALGACGDHPNPAESSSNLQPQHLLPGGGGGGGLDPLPSLSALTLSSTALVINGPSVSYTATIDDPISGWTLRADIFQGSTQVSLGAVSVPCGAPSTSCTVSSTIRATSTLAPGTGTFRLQLLNKFGIVAGAKSVTVSLVPRPTIGVTLSSLHILLDGPAIPYTLTIHNSGPGVSGVSLESWLSQDGIVTHTAGARRAAGAGAIQCGSGAGILPTGTCTTTMALVASNHTDGSGLLVPGLTQVELNLTESGVPLATGPSLSIHIDTSATVVAGSGLSLSSNLSSTNPTEVTLEGASVPYAITLQNTGSARSGISVRTSVTQKTATRDAGSTLVSCGSDSGIVPSGACTFSFQITASNASAGTGTLLAGASASLAVDVVDANGVVLTHIPELAPLTLLQPEGPPPPPSANVVRAGGLALSRTKP